MRTLQLFVIFSLIAFAGKKERNWQTGRILDSEQSRVFLGTVTDSSTTGSATGSSTTTGGLTTGAAAGRSHTTGVSRAVFGKEDTQIIEGDKYVYIVSRMLRFRWNRTANVAVNADVKYATEGTTLYLLDDDGREHKTKVVKRVLKVKQ